MLPNFSYVRPASVNEAIKALASGDAHLHAGGTDLLPCLRDGVFTAKKLVSIGGIADLRGIRVLDDGRLRIGALATLTEIAEHPVVRQRYAVLAQAAQSAASPQLRNQGTLGGNLCQRPRCWYFRGDFPCLRKGGDTCFAQDGENEYHCIFGGNGCYMVHPSDTAPALVALDGRARIAGPGGTRTVALDSFFVSPSEEVTRETVLKPNEVLTEILIPPVKDLRSSYRKVRTRGSWDFALVGVAVALQLTEGHVARANIVLSGVAPVPWRALAAAKEITGQRLDAAIISRAAAAAIKGAEPLSQNAYKVDLVHGVVQESLTAMT
ncbi:MAG TPA: xanthine dehydrogenase family protein subunit M [Bryobacteraceae bacterium]|nr:xanthine dehydrogenase family protein subunit M [Bryobacteraceae bacterium]